MLGCPVCAAKLDLLDTRDGDQAYWCHRCQSGWRAGNLPETAHRSKDNQNAQLEPPLETSAPAEPAVTQKARAAKTKATAKVGAVLPTDEVISAVNAPERRGQLASRPRVQGIASRPRVQGTTLAPLTRPDGRHRTQGEAKKHPFIAPRVTAKPPAPQLVAPRRGASPRAAASPPKPPVITKPSRPPPRAANVAVSTPKTAAPKNALETVQKNPSLETGRKDSRRAAQTAAPISKPVKAKPQPLEKTATPARLSSQTGVQKSPRKALEITASVPQPKRTKRSPLETAAPIKAPRVKPSRPDKPALETSQGSRKAAQTAALAPKVATDKRLPLEAVAAPKISTARAAPQKPPKKTLETTPSTKPTRRKKPILEIAAAAPQKTRQRRPVPAAEPTPKPRRISARAAALLKPARVSPEQRKSRNAPIGKATINKAQTAPVSQSRAQRSAAPLEPSPKSRRAAQVAARPSPAPVKSPKPVPAKPEPTRAARVAKQPVTAASRPKPIRSSPARPAPSNPVQFGLFDALPPKTAGRKQR